LFVLVASLVEHHEEEEEGLSITFMFETRPYHGKVFSRISILLLPSCDFKTSSILSNGANKKSMFLS
jgi:hypothetical protein